MDAGLLIRDIKKWIGKFATCKFQFCHRSNNTATHIYIFFWMKTATHILARYDRYIDDSRVWLDVEPDIISQIIWFDKLGFS